MTEHPPDVEAGMSTPTGDDRVDQAIGRLAELDDRPVHEHAVVIEDIHRTLQDTLVEPDGMAGKGA